jgi:hypothetical protein
MAAFKVGFRTDIAATLGPPVTPSDVIVTSIVAGSLKVDFDVNASHGNVLPDAAATLSSGPIVFAALRSDPIVSAAAGSTFAAAIAPTAVTASYSSDACANAAVICGSHATCTTKPTGFQCTCAAGYGTSPAANTAASCLQPTMTTALKPSGELMEPESSSVPIVPILVGGSAALFLLGASIAVCERRSHSSKGKVEVIETTQIDTIETPEEEETRPVLEQVPPIPMADAAVVSAPAAAATLMPTDVTTTLLMMQQQQNNFMQQSNLMQQQNSLQHAQQMEREANRERAERAAAQERADRQAGLERVNVHATQSAHSEASQAMQLNAAATTQALAATNVGVNTVIPIRERAPSQAVDTSGDSNVDSIIMDTTGDGKLDKIIPLDPSQPQPKENDSRPANRTTANADLQMEATVGLGEQLEQAKAAAAVQAEQMAAEVARLTAELQQHRAKETQRGETDTSRKLRKRLTRQLSEAQVSHANSTQQTDEMKPKELTDLSMNDRKDASNTKV